MLKNNNESGIRRRNPSLEEGVFHLYVTRGLEVPHKFMAYCHIGYKHWYGDLPRVDIRILFEKDYLQITRIRNKNNIFDMEYPNNQKLIIHDKCS